jgi:glycosyltransferase involved in cell wall biosynthesis
MLLGDGALYIDPAQHADLEAALARVLESDSLRQRMRGAGLMAVRQLTWDAAAQQMMNLIQQIGAS